MASFSTLFLKLQDAVAQEIQQQDVPTWHQSK